MRRFVNKDDSNRRPPRWYADDDGVETAQTSTQLSPSQSLKPNAETDKEPVASSATNDENSIRPQSSLRDQRSTPHEDEGAAITLPQFVQKYSEVLPAEITIVERGAHGGPVALNDKDVYKIDRIKEHSMVLARASKNQQYLVPFNAAIEFCLLYDPESNISKALNGYSFATVSELIAAEVKPKLVCARSPWRDKETGVVTVSNREVFVLSRNAVSTVTKKGKRCIKMYSITKQVAKELPDNCAANFSTKPSLVPLYLAEIMEYVRNPFPCKAVLHDEGLIVPPHFASLVKEQNGLVLNLVSASRELVLEATYNRDYMNSSIVMEIPVKLPLVKVKVLKCSRAGLRHTDCDNRIKDSPNTSKESANGMCYGKKDGGGCEKEQEVELEEEEEDEEEEEEEGSIKEQFPEWTGQFQSIGRVENNEVLQSHGQYCVDPKIQSAPLSVSRFADQYSHCLPMHVKVVENSHVAESNVLVDELYKVHFVARSSGVTLVDEKGFLVFVPSDSSTALGVIFNPHDDLDVATKGYVFESVDDVLRAARLPRVLCATKAHRSSSPASSVEAGEVLIVQKVEIDLQLKGNALTVYSTKEGSTKTLRAECRGYFSTDPNLVRLHVSVMLEHLSLVPPTFAMMYLAGQGGDALMSEPAKVTVLRLHDKPSLVVTSLKSGSDEYQLLEIPLDNNAVRMVVLQTNTRGPTRPAEAINMGSAAEMRGLVNAPHSAVHLPHKLIAEQDAARHTPGWRAPIPEDQYSTQSSESCNPNWKQQEGATQNEVNQSIAKTVSNLKDLYDTLNRNVAELNGRVTELTEKVISLQANLEAANGRMCLACNCNCKNVHVSRDGPQKAERHYLETFTSEEVLRLLDSAGLGSYAEAFDKEKINGHLLCALTDTMLQQDLNVSSAFHRRKLLNIISGTADVRSLMTCCSSRNTTV